MSAAIYVRASSREQAVDGLTIPEQKSRLAKEASHRGWPVGTVVVDQATGKKMRGRQLALLLDQLDAGQFDSLLVTRLDRIARSLIDFLPVLDRSSRHGWKLVMLDPAVDTTTPYGKAMAQMGGVFAELEGALISQRTREGLAYARERGTFRPGEHSRFSNPLVVRKIMRWHEQGHGAPWIAERLELEGTPSPRAEQLQAAYDSLEAYDTPEAANLEELLGRAWPWHHRTINRIINREKG